MLQRVIHAWDACRDRMAAGRICRGAVAVAIDAHRAAKTPVNALAAGFAASRPSISKHLRILHEAELVAEQRRGRERLYRLRPETLAEVADWADGYRRLWKTSLEALERHLGEQP